MIQVVRRRKAVTMTEPTIDEWQEESERLSRILLADYLEKIRLQETIKKTETLLEWVNVQLRHRIQRAFREQARAMVENECKDNA